MDARARIDEMHAVARLAERDATLFADPVIAADRLGWVGSPSAALEANDELVAWAGTIATSPITDVVLLGMGGSSLTPFVLSRVIGAASGFPALHVVETTAPDEVASLMRRLLPASTLVVVSSKSGTTIETCALGDIFHGWLQAHLGASAGAHLVAITDPGSPLEMLARQRGFLSVRHAPADIGGRYGAFTPFAMLPAALIGIDTRRLAHAGARREAACAVPMPENPAAAFAAWLSDGCDAGRDKLTIVCSRTLAPFGLWAEQLMAESTGKDGLGVLPVLESPAQPDAHGPDRLTFVLRTSGDTKLATLRTRLPVGEPVFEVVMDDPYEIAAEFVRWQWAVALLAALRGIEPFDQPDVEYAKAATRAILAAPQEAPAPTDSAAGVAVTTGAAAASGLVPALAALVADIPPRGYLAVLAYLPGSERLLAPLREACAAVAAARLCPVTLELGPRYLHSTGQFHKGGPESACFLVVSAPDEADLDVPGQPFSLARLHRAQTAGDIATLFDRGRTVTAVELPHADFDSINDLADALTRAVRP